MIKKDKIVRYALSAALFVAACVILPACSSKRNAAADTEKTPARGKVKAKASGTAGALAETYTQWETFYAPFTLRSSKPAAMSVSGRATMVRGKSIYLSLRMLGFEMASVYLDPDSAIIVDKYHKMYVAEPVSAVTARTGLNIGDIQDILLGRAFSPQEGTLCDVEIPQIKFVETHSESETILTPRGLPDGVEWFYTVNETPSLSKLTIVPEGREPFIICFDRFADNTPAGAVAQDVMVVGNVSGKPLEAMIQWNLSKARWNEPAEQSLPSLRGYRKMSVGELMEILKHI